MPLAGRPKRPRIDEILNGSMEEHFRLRSYASDTLETLELYYSLRPENYNPWKNSKDGWYETQSL